jgi:hypothetical protein
VTRGPDRDRLRGQNKSARVTASANLEASYDWKGRHWAEPLNPSVSRLTELGSQMVSIAGGVRYYLESPAGGPTWGLRLTLTLLFPR